MAAASDYLPIATGAGNNADSQVNFAGSGYQTLGFTTGTANPAQANKCWRQSSMWASAWSWVVANALNVNVQDDGNLAALITLIGSALATIINTAINTAIGVPFSVQRVVTGARAYGAVYRNTTTGTMMITVCGQAGSGGGGQSANTDNNPAPATEVCVSNRPPAADSDPQQATSMTFMVLPGNYYQVNTGGLTLVLWTEWTNA